MFRRARTISVAPVSGRRPSMIGPRQLRGPPTGVRQPGVVASAEVQARGRGRAKSVVDGDFRRPCSLRKQHLRRPRRWRSGRVHRPVRIGVCGTDRRPHCAPPSPRAWRRSSARAAGRCARSRRQDRPASPAHPGSSAALARMSSDDEGRGTTVLHRHLGDALAVLREGAAASICVPVCSFHGQHVEG